MVLLYQRTKKIGSFLDFLLRKPGFTAGFRLVVIAVDASPFVNFYNFKARPYNFEPGTTTQVTVPEIQDPVKPSGRRKALLIGVNYVGTKSRLHGCADDAKTLRHVLLQHNFLDDPEHMVIMIDEFDDDLNSNSPLPTKENIHKGL